MITLEFQSQKSRISPPKKEGLYVSMLRQLQSSSRARSGDRGRSHDNDCKNKSRMPEVTLEVQKNARHSKVKQVKLEKDGNKAGHSAAVNKVVQNNLWPVAER